MDDGITTVPFFIAEKIVVIKNVPAEICTDCGEAYMKSLVVGEIEWILDRLEELHSEVSIIYYKQPEIGVGLEKSEISYHLTRKINTRSSLSGQ